MPRSHGSSGAAPLDLDTGAIIAAELHAADQGDTVNLPVTLEAAMEQLAGLMPPPRQRRRRS